MIRFLNVYYPTRTVDAVCFAKRSVVSGCFLAATWIVLRDQTVFALFQLWQRNS